VISDMSTVEQPLRLGVIGMDTSHVVAFADLLHDTSHRDHVEGARIVAGYPGGSPDFEFSMSRVRRFAGEMQAKHPIQMVSEVEELRDLCEAVLLLSIDGRRHLREFRQIIGWEKPVFIDKPLAVSSDEARKIVEMAAENRVRVTTSSALRFSEAFQRTLRDEEGGAVTGGDFYGPLGFQDIAPGYFWYGIHTAEMLFATLGPGCCEVRAFRTPDHDVVVGCWKDGRLGTIRGSRTGASQFGGTIHRETRSTAFSDAESTRPYYAGLLRSVVSFFKGGANPVPPEESLEIIRFLEAANESAEKGSTVQLT
jgi:predicted dehydrogenase